MRTTPQRGSRFFARDRGGPAFCFKCLGAVDLDDRLQVPSTCPNGDVQLWNCRVKKGSWDC
jgi:predicted Zn-ribbon and HTH transcriptional regulator